VPAPEKSATTPEDENEQAATAQETAVMRVTMTICHPTEVMSASSASRQCLRTHSCPRHQ
jgi:hypothetical protein